MQSEVTLVTVKIGVLTQTQQEIWAFQAWTKILFLTLSTLLFDNIFCLLPLLEKEAQFSFNTCLAHYITQVQSKE